MISLPERLWLLVGEEVGVKTCLRMNDGEEDDYGDRDRDMDMDVMGSYLPQLHHLVHQTQSLPPLSPLSLHDGGIEEMLVGREGEEESEGGKGREREAKGGQVSSQHGMG